MSAVEWKKLGEVCEVYTGGDSPNDCIKGQESPSATHPYPVFSNGDTTYGYCSTYRIDKDSVTISSIGNVGSVKYRDGFFTPIIRLKVILPKTNSLNTKYLYYHLLGVKFIGTNSSLSSMKAADIKGVIIPIPSLSKQQEIVSHLDAFTTLISSLESELEIRRKQYEHYRNQLLDFEGVDGVEWKTLGEVGEFVRGNGIQKKDFVEDGYGCIHYGQVYTQFDLLAYETITEIEKVLYDKCRKAKCGDIVLATTSENLEDVAKPVIWLGDEEIAVSGDAFIYKHNQNPIFIGSQFLTERFSKFKGMNAKGAKVIRITGDSMAEYKIALPSLEKQNVIAEGIKSFENLIQSLEQEIKLRKQQYEYYREKLLTFE